MPWRMAWQPASGFSPGESHGQRNLVDYSPGGQESDMTERLSLSLHLHLQGSGLGGPVEYVLWVVPL